MNTIIVKSQKELDSLPAKFKDYTRIEIRAGGVVSVNKARENSSVEAWENSSVVAWGNSSVEARENSSVEARENSSVEAWDNSSVEAWGNVGVHLQSDFASVILFSFSVCWALAMGKIQKKSGTSVVIKPKVKKGLPGWLENNGVKSSLKIILYKKVSKDFLTQEETENETSWKVGTILEHPSWNPRENECGKGKFHACPKPYLCDEFRDEKGDRYIAVEIARKDLYAWPNPSYPHKIGFRRGKVLYECDRFGREK